MTISKVFDLQAPTLETSTAGGQFHSIEAGPEDTKQQHWQACGGQGSVGEPRQAVLHHAWRPEAEALSVLSGLPWHICMPAAPVHTPCGVWGKLFPLLQRHAHAGRVSN